MIPISQLVTPLTGAQVFATFMSNLQSAGIPANTWRVGGAYRTIVQVAANLFATFTQVMANFVAAAFLDYATGDWLTACAWFVFGVERTPATFATGPLTLTNTGGGMFDFGPGEAVFSNPQTNATYTNQDAFTLGSGGTITLDIQATVQGSASTSGPGAISNIVTTMVGVTCSNASAVVGSDAQSDPDLIQACKDSRASSSPNGPSGAYAYAVRTTTRPDGSPVNINRVSVASSGGQVTIYCASPSGTPTDDDISYAQASVDATAEPDTDTATVTASSTVAISKSFTVWATQTAGVSASDLQTTIINALANAIAVYPIGGIAMTPATQGYLYDGFIEGVCKQAVPSVFNVTGLDGDVALSAGQVATLTATVTVRLAPTVSA